jgi:hypothetical protein
VAEVNLGTLDGIWFRLPEYQSSQRLRWHMRKGKPELVLQLNLITGDQKLYFISVFQI